ncbi:MAG: hypothetical protein WCP72_11965, partial [Desulfomonile sp.]
SIYVFHRLTDLFTYDITDQEELLLSAVRLHQRRGLSWCEAEALQRPFSRWRSGLSRSDREALTVPIRALLISW